MNTYYNLVIEIQIVSSKGFLDYFFHLACFRTILTIAICYCQCYLSGLYSGKEILPAKELLKNTHIL